MFQKYINRRREREQRQYRVERNSIIFSDAVRWLGCHFPVLEEVEKLMAADQSMTMSRRSEIFERCGVGGLSLMQVIALNNRILDTLTKHSDWTSCSLSGDQIHPFAFGKELFDLFSIDAFNTRLTIPSLTINVAREKDITHVNRAVELFRRDSRINVATVVAPKIIVTYQPTFNNTPYLVGDLKQTAISNIYTLN